MCTHYRCEMPNRSIINLHHHEVVAKISNDTISNYVAPLWEQLCRDAVSKNHLLGSVWGVASR